MIVRALPGIGCPSGINGWWDDFREGCVDPATGKPMGTIKCLLLGGSEEVNHLDISELTIRDPSTLDPATRARLEASVAQGRARAAQHQQNAALLRMSLIGAAVVGGLLLLSKVTS